MTKKYKLNMEKNIGSVILILENSKTEFVILETIFVKPLKYSLEQLKRETNGFVLKGNNPISKVIALNFHRNHLFELNDDELN